MYQILTTCRACGGPLRRVLSLGHTPLANALTDTRYEAMSLPKFPLNLCLCESCWFTQLDVAIDSSVLFEHYVYVTPHARSLTDHYAVLISEISSIMGLEGANVIEMGSNNGAFIEAIRPYVGSIVGVEPAKNIAEQAARDGIPTIAEFFSEATVPSIMQQAGSADLFVARHCMAHLNDLRGTLRAIASILKPDGLVAIENAYLPSTLSGAQFDQIYHEHMSYFSLRPLVQLMKSVGLHPRHAYVSPIHGGSIVVMASLAEGPTTQSYQDLWDQEASLVDDLEQFAFVTRATVGGLRMALESLVDDGMLIYTYGATAKGNTLLNATGLTHKHIPFAVDSTPLKWGKFLPGSGIQVVSEDETVRAPNAYLLTAWNYAKEIMAKQQAFRDGGGKFIQPLPTTRLLR